MKKQRNKSTNKKVFVSPDGDAIRFNRMGEVRYFPAHYDKALDTYYKDAVQIDGGNCYAYMEFLSPEKAIKCRDSIIKQMKKAG